MGRPLLDLKLWRQQAKGRLKRCPRCKQKTEDRIYLLDRVQVRALAIMHVLCRNEPTGWIPRDRVVEQMPRGVELGGKLARLRYWGFAAMHPKHRGMWATTDRAAEFLHGRMRVPAKMGLCEWKETDKLIGFFGPMVTVGEVMKTGDFDLNALLDSGRPSLNG